MKKKDYYVTLLRKMKKGNFNLILAVKGYPGEHDVHPALGFGLGELILNAIQHMTPRQLLNVFPLKKTFDGEHFYCKDYFSAMKTIREYGMDPTIENAAAFLWDYTNDDIGNFLADYLCFVSDIYKERTGGDLAQDAMEQAHIPYSAYTHDGETRVEIPNLPAWQELGMF